VVADSSLGEKSCGPWLGIQPRAAGRIRSHWGFLVLYVRGGGSKM
jgi:hypothetical protein